MNRYLRQFFYTGHVMPVLVDLNCDIGAAGAPSNLKGTLVSSITRLSAGIYQIKLQDNFFKLYGVEAILMSPPSGSAIDPNAATVGTVYQITTVGNTDWATAGLPTGFTPAVGQVLKLAAQPASGTGRVQPIGQSTVASCEIVGDGAKMLAPAGSAKGALITVQMLAATSAGVTTPIAADPASGSRLYLKIYLSNSSIQVQGE